jgi:steroid delta-isomerase-like uncharacterized protein
MADSIASNKEITHRFMDECWNLGKIDSVRELVADDCRIHDPVFPLLTSGVDNLARHICSCRNGFPDLYFTIDDTIAERNEVVIHWTAHGSHRGDFLGMRPTNRSATVSGTSIFRMEGAMIAEMWADWNLMSLMEQLGVPTAQTAEAKTRA